MYGMIEFIIIFPVFLLLGVTFISSPFVWLASLSILYILGFLFRLIVRDKKRLLYLVYTIIVSATLAVLFNDTIVSYLVVLIINGVICYRGILYAEREVEELISFTSLWKFGFPIYFTAYFVYRFSDSLNLYLDVITWSCFLLVVITLFLSNSGSLKSSTLSKQKRPFVTGSIKGKNRVYIVVILSIIAIITNFKVLQHLLYTAISAVISAIISFFSIFENDEQIENTPPASEGSMPPPLEGGEPSALAVLMEKIAEVGFYILAVVGGIIFIFFASKKVRHLFRLGYKWFMNYLNQLFHIRKSDHEENSQYVDEKESLLDLKKWGQGTKNQAKELFSTLFNRQPKWDELSDREKVRYVYRQLVKEQVNRGLPFKISDTPSKTIKDMSERRGNQQKELRTFIDTYGKARYGNDDLNSQDLEEVTFLLDSLKNKEG